MRIVVSPDEVVQKWLRQEQNTARNSGDTFYFRGRTIYSYNDGFPIAHIYEHKPVILYTTRDYSVTTARHKSKVLNQLGKNVVCCTNVLAKSQKEHNQNIYDYVMLIHEKVNKLSRCRNEAIILDYIEHYKNCIKKYCECFNLSYDEIAELNPCFNVTNKEEAKVFVNNQSSVFQGLIDEWFNNRLEELPYVAYQKLPYIPIRYKEGCNYFENAKSTRMTYEKGKIVYDNIKKYVETDYINLTETEKPFGYEIRSINKKIIHVGCTRISVNDILKIGQKLNW